MELTGSFKMPVTIQKYVVWQLRRPQPNLIFHKQGNLKFDRIVDVNEICIVTN